LFHPAFKLPLGDVSSRGGADDEPGGWTPIATLRSTADGARPANSGSAVPTTTSARSVGSFPVSLFWRVFLVNASLVTVAVILLAITPLTVSDPVTARQLSVLALGLGCLLVANFLLLRMSLLPLQRLRHLMDRIDLLQPGERLEVAGARELNAVSSAFNRMLIRLERERQLSSSRAVGREEEQRRRLASELHDQVGQGLTAVLLQLKSAIAESPSPVRPELLEAQRITRENLEEVRRIARRLRPAALDDLGLPYALLALADAVAEQDGPEIVRHVDTSMARLPEEVELAIYRVAQEALTNVTRHAGASTINIALGAEASSDQVTLVVDDDGRGMIYVADVEGGGIRGMRERALAVGGRLSFSSRPGGGTRVMLTVPA